MILVPVKNLGNAKQRLSSLLDAAARTELAQAMLSDVLGAIADFAGDEVALVTSDPFARDLAKHHGFEIIRDDSNASETAAIEMATDACASRGVQTTLVLPGDIPLIEAEDVRAIYQSAPSRGSVLVPSSEKRGSNAVLRRPAGLFRLRFGNDSFMPHLAAAIATDTACVVLSLPRIGLDIDTPEDLLQLEQSAGEKRSQLLARSLLKNNGMQPVSVADS
jgi:2-phospho-L-lactate/phosphoenolpyruvate guanylyltransferase